MKTTLKLRTLLLMLIAMVSFAAVACDDDEEDTGTDMTTGDTTGGDTTTGDTTTGDTTTGDTTTGDTTTGDTTTGDTTTGDTTTGDTGDTVEPAGACLNSPDIDLINANDPPPSDVAATCGRDCFTGGESGDGLVTCTVTCMQAEPGLETLETDCATCYAESVRCTVEECLTECLADSSAPGCIQCREEKGCTPGFYTCSGLTPP